MSDFSLSIRNWYRQNKRDLPWRNTSDAYFIWLSEIIMQQTRVEQGTKYYLKFIAHYPTVTDLANADEKDILNDWQGLGYYSRARNLHHSAKIIRDEFKGVFPNNYKDILQLKGVGKYTAAAISSFAFNEVYAVVDGNVYRLLSRVFDIDLPIDSSQGQKYFQELADELIITANPAEHNQSIMELGAKVCKPVNPLCSQCPLSTQCLALQKKTIEDRPVKSKKVKIRNRYFHFLVFTEKKQILIEQRTEKDIWQNMYQFPLVETAEKASQQESEIWKSQFSESEPIKHILSHQKITAVFHHINKIPKNKSNNWNLINIHQIQDYPLPRIIDKYLEEFSDLF
ncbi:MAG: A/G-specific adenine glycosylase [Fluviicola sp.]|nr:A/G-specific adenine glycosylase [Fluviicola sp.]